MRLTVTVVSPATGRQADVAIEAGPGTTLAQVAAELDRLMHGLPATVPITGPEPWVPALFVGGHRVPGDMRLAGSPLLDGQPADAAAYWRPGQQVTIGNTLLELVPYEPPDAALNPAEDGAGLEFNRPPRLLPPGITTRFRLPAPPGRPERRPVPVLMAVAPVLLGVGMAYFLRQVYMLAMAAFSPVMLLGSYVSDRRGGRKSHARQLADYSEHKARVEREAAEAADAERLRRRHDCPDPAAVASIASGPRRRLWERRRTDPDYLLLRLGTADLPSAVELTDPAQDEHRRRRYWLIPDAPVTVALAGAGRGRDSRARGHAAGRRPVAGSPGRRPAQPRRRAGLRAHRRRRAGRLGVGPVAAALPSGPCAAAGQNCAALIGNDAETVAARIAELTAIIKARHQALREQGPGCFGPDIVVVFDGSRRLRSLPGAVGILREGRQVGVYSICLDADERLLPAECQAVAAAGPDGTLTVAADGRSPPSPRSGPNTSRPAWAERLARSLAPIRDVSGDEEDTGLPASCRLLDILGLDPPDAAAIAARWQAGGSGAPAADPRGR